MNDFFTIEQYVVNKLKLPNHLKTLVFEYVQPTIYFFKDKKKILNMLPCEIIVKNPKYSSYYQSYALKRDIILNNYFDKYRYSQGGDNLLYFKYEKKRKKLNWIQDDILIRKLNHLHIPIDNKIYVFSKCAFEKTYVKTKDFAEYKKTFYYPIINFDEQIFEWIFQINDKIYKEKDLSFPMDDTELLKYLNNFIITNGKNENADWNGFLEKLEICQVSSKVKMESTYDTFFQTLMKKCMDNNYLVGLEKLVNTKNICPFNAKKIYQFINVLNYRKSDNGERFVPSSDDRYKYINLQNHDDNIWKIIVNSPYVPIDQRVAVAYGCGFRDLMIQMLEDKNIIFNSECFGTTPGVWTFHLNEKLFDKIGIKVSIKNNNYEQYMFPFESIKKQILEKRLPPNCIHYYYKEQIIQNGSIEIYDHIVRNLDKKYYITISDILFKFSRSKNNTKEEKIIKLVNHILTTYTKNEISYYGEYYYDWYYDMARNLCGKPVYTIKLLDSLIIQDMFFGNNRYDFGPYFINSEKIYNFLMENDMYDYSKNGNEILFEKINDGYDDDDDIKILLKNKDVLKKLNGQNISEFYMNFKYVDAKKEMKKLRENYYTGTYKHVNQSTLQKYDDLI